MIKTTTNIFLVKPLLKALTLTTFVLSILSTNLYADSFTIVQSVTGNNRTDLRGQVFIPEQQGSGTGTVTTEDTVYLTSFEVVYYGTEAPVLYIYSSLPSHVASLDDGTGGVLVGESNSKADGSFPFTKYTFDKLALHKSTQYYAVFRQDVHLEFGGSGSIEGPYAGGKMLKNTGTAVVPNDFAALKFNAEFENPVTDVDILKIFYQSTNGDNWTNSWDIDGDPNSWEGVTWEGDKVRVLSLAGNNLTGTLPPELGDLQILERISLGSNSIGGSIPAELSKLSNLFYLDLGPNELTGSIPKELGNLIGLTTLNLGVNNLSGAIPAELGNLINIIGLTFPRNELSGEIPPELGNLTNVLYLYLSDNQLTGSIPSELGNLSRLGVLDIARNMLSGTVPNELGNLTELEVLELDENELTGTIPSELGNLPKLVLLDLSENQLNGSIPVSFGDLTNLEYLFLWKNQLSGIIPTELSNLVKLKFLSLSQNEISGAIPAELGDLTQLQYMYLWQNQLTGNIPITFGNFPEMLELSLSNNQLSGSIPAELGDLDQLKILYLQSNQLSGELPATLGELDSLKKLSLLNNQLSGVIPSELGNLEKLELLYLSNNDLEGDLPEEFSGLSKLTHFKMDSNNITTLPDLSALPLEEFYVSQNKLTFESLEPNKGVISENNGQQIFGEAQEFEVRLGASITLSFAVGGTSNVYQWTKDGTEIDGATENSLVLDNYEAADSGVYQLWVSNDVVTDITLESQEIKVSTSSVVTSVDENTFDESEMTFYPNPMYNEVTLYAPEIDKDVEIEVYDLAGAKLPSTIQRIADDRIKIYVSGDRSGAIIVKINDGKQVVHRRLMKR